MLANSEEFYQSLQLPNHVVAIVSGALNNAAAAKYDLEAWFPFQGEYKELVSCSNCTDYQSRRLDVRCGFKKPGDTKPTFVHMLNGTLCATERALCCVVENWQTPDGLKIPPPLQPYMGGRDFLPYLRELPKNTTSQKKK
jgi:seryl-tRNA synthetase